jgi:hypothetical protein
VIKVIMRVQSADDLALAGRAAANLIKNSAKRDAWLVYGDEQSPVAEFYVRRNESSITVRQVVDGVAL